jgi:hypothetical protein
VECARPVEFPEGNPIQQGELEHFQDNIVLFAQEAEVELLKVYTTE